MPNKWYNFHTYRPNRGITFYEQKSVSTDERVISRRIRIRRGNGPMRSFDADENWQIIGKEGSPKKRKKNKQLEILVCIKGACSASADFKTALRKAARRYGSKRSSFTPVIKERGCQNECGLGYITAVWDRSLAKSYFTRKRNGLNLRHVLPSNPYEALAKIIEENVPGEYRG